MQPPAHMSPMIEPTQCRSSLLDEFPASFVVGSEFPDGRTPFLLASREVRDLFGFAPEEPVDPEQMWRRLRSKDREEAQKALRLAKKEGGECRFGFSMGTGDKARWFQVRFRPVTNPEGTTHWWGFFTDVTEERKREAGLQADLDLFVRLFREGPVARILSRRIDGMIFEVNDQFLEQFGFEQDEVIGHTFVQLGILTAEQRQELLPQINPEDVSTLTVPLKLRDGETRTFRILVSPVDYDGMDCQLGTFFDISERIRFETEILEKNDALAEANARLREIGRIRQRFTAMLVHDLKSPLTTIQVLLDLVPMEDPEISEVGTLARRSIEKVLRLVNEMLELSKLDSGEQVLARETINLAALLADCVSSAERMGVPKNIGVTFECEPGLPFVPGDPGKLDRVFSNLLSNALKFTPDEGRIAIVAKVKRGVDVEEGMKFVTVTITDSGPGIPAEDLPYIFDLYRQSKASRGQSGVGLGLAIVKSIVAAHGGKVSVKSKVGVGTQFAVTLPAVRTTGAYPVARFLAEMEKKGL